MYVDFISEYLLNKALFYSEWVKREEVPTLEHLHSGKQGGDGANKQLKSHQLIKKSRPREFLSNLAQGHMAKK